MEKMPTAWEIFNKYSDKANRIQEMHFEEMMIEFAKLHVEAALKAAVENAETKWIKYTDNDYEVDEDSILNSYPIENIK